MTKIDIGLYECNLTINYWDNWYSWYNLNIKYQYKLVKILIQILNNVKFLFINDIIIIYLINFVIIYKYK